MNSIINYILAMCPVILLSLPFFLTIRFTTYKMVLKAKINWYHEILLLLLFMFILGLLSIALTGDFNIRNFDIDRINLIPFKILVETYNEVFINHNLNYFIISFLGNIIMFIPIGLLIPILFKIKNLTLIFIGFSLSLFIEINQLFLVRGTDIDDIIFNTLGTILGLLIYKLLCKKFKNRLDKFKLIKL